MWLPQTMGVAPLRLGISSFQATFSVVDHFSGTPFSVLTPFACGPRHAGQFSRGQRRDGSKADGD